MSTRSMIGTAITRPYSDVPMNRSLRRRRKPISHPAGDGLKIPAFLTLPSGAGKGFAANRLAAWRAAAADTLEALTGGPRRLAAQGYAVLQPNYRGSTVSQPGTPAGRLRRSGAGRCKPTCSDGVRYLARRRASSTRRGSASSGASYGGYAALAGVRPSESGSVSLRRVRLPVHVGPATDSTQHRRSAPARVAILPQRYWDRFRGERRTQSDPALGRRVAHRACRLMRVDVPVLLIQWTRTTPWSLIEQSEVMESARLEARRKIGAPWSPCSMKIIGCRALGDPAANAASRPSIFSRPTTRSN